MSNSNPFNIETKLVLNKLYSLLKFIGNGIKDQEEFKDKQKEVLILLLKYNAKLENEDKRNYIKPDIENPYPHIKGKCGPNKGIRITKEGDGLEYTDNKMSKYEDQFKKLDWKNQGKAIKFATLSDYHYGFMKHFLRDIMLKFRSRKNGYIDANVILDFIRCCNYSGNKPFGCDKFKNNEEYNKWKEKYEENLKEE